MDFQTLKKAFTFYEELIVRGVNPLLTMYHHMGTNLNVGTDDNPKLEMVQLVDMESYNPEQYLALVSKTTSRELLHTLELMIFEIKDTPNYNLLISKFNNDLKYYIKKLREEIFIKRYLFILKDLEDIIPEIEEKLKHYKILIEENTSKEDKNLEDNVEIKKVENYKIKWLANNNVLYTLFYDLLYGQGSVPPLIEAASPQIVQDFIIRNFVDSKGDDFSEESVRTTLYPGRDDKRVNKGTRVEIDKESINLKNVKVKRHK